MESTGLNKYCIRLSKLATFLCCYITIYTWLLELKVFLQLIAVENLFVLCVDEITTVRVHSRYHHITPHDAVSVWG
jgi:hypothetical protein